MNKKDIFLAVTYFGLGLIGFSFFMATYHYFYLTYIQIPDIILLIVGAIFYIIGNTYLVKKNGG